MDKYIITHKKEKYVFVLITTVLVSMIAHGYRYLNPVYSHDSLLNVFQNDELWQISLGRFFEPMAMAIRGALCPPWLIACIAMFLYSLAIYIVVDMLDIDNKILIIATVAILICCDCITITNAAYLHCVDVFAAALFFACYGIRLMNKQKCGAFLLGSLSIAICLGLYQAYVDVAIVFALLLILKKLMNGKATIKEILAYGVYNGAFLLLGAVEYVLMWKLTQVFYGVGTTDSYNGLATVGNYEGYSIRKILIGVYTAFFDYFRSINMFSANSVLGMPIEAVWLSLVRLFALITGIIILAGVFRINQVKKNPIWNCCLQIVVLLLFPLAANFVYLISKGMEHVLMIFSFQFFYVFAVMVVCEWMKLDEEKKIFRMAGKKIIPIAMVMAISIPVWCNIVYSNQIYLKEDLQQGATLSLMTRIVNDIEKTEGYKAGLTPVYIWGAIQDQQSYITMPGFEGLVGLGVYDSPITYHDTQVAFLNYFMSYRVKVVSNADIFNQGVEEFPVYPADGSIQYVNGVLVVKLSD